MKKGLTIAIALVFALAMLAGAQALAQEEM